VPALAELEAEAERARQIARAFFERELKGAARGIA
jgi:hypothetical protein